MIINFLQETKEAIAKSGHSDDDIVFIGSQESGYQLSCPEFCRLADFWYDHRCGLPNIAIDLIIVLSDGQKIWRASDEEGEWWEYSTPFVRPENTFPIHRLICEPGRGQQSLAEINEDIS
ncbi:MAG: hypothetical protein Q8L15_06915 [Methylobacter sp.]|nr:hypothetical protein [Methylobacter sp.]